jgi:hypothetical protein
MIFDMYRLICLKFRQAHFLNNIIFFSVKVWADFLYITITNNSSVPHRVCVRLRMDYSSQQKS